LVAESFLVISLNNFIISKATSRSWLVSISAHSSGSLVCWAFDAFEDSFSFF
jgi:hypothetical protein